MSNLSDWSERCFRQGIEVHQLKNYNEVTGLYMTKQRIGDGNPCYYYTFPMYHVWVNDVNLYTLVGYSSAYNLYLKEVGI
jgi:hypothetical protein